MPDSSPWYKRKSYPHFDLPLSKKAAERLLVDFRAEPSHAFHPLIAYKISTPRIRKNPLTRKVARDPGTGRPIQSKKERPIAYPSHTDGYIFSYYKSLLEVPYERWLKENDLGESVTAFRRLKKNNITLAKEVFDYIEVNPACRIIATDVEGFFEHIDHQVLKDIWKKFSTEYRLPNDQYAVYKAITKYSTVDRSKLYQTFSLSIRNRSISKHGPERICSPSDFRVKVVAGNLVERNSGWERGAGIPQGTSLSPLLSNIYMADFDIAMHRRVAFLGGRYWRYCDDILVVIPSLLEYGVLACIDDLLDRLKLRRSKEKTQIIYGSQLTRKQLQYLGFLFNGSKIAIRSSSIHRYHHKLKRAIQAAKIKQLNESKGKIQAVPFRKQSLYNMYSELSLRGRKITLRKRNQKYPGNFTHYMEKSTKIMDSLTIKLQRKGYLSDFERESLDTLRYGDITNNDYVKSLP